MQGFRVEGRSAQQPQQWMRVFELCAHATDPDQHFQKQVRPAQHLPAVLLNLNLVGETMQ